MNVSDLPVLKTKDSVPVPRHALTSYTACDVKSLHAKKTIFLLVALLPKAFSMKRKTHVSSPRKTVRFDMEMVVEEM